MKRLPAGVHVFVLGRAFLQFEIGKLGDVLVGDAVVQPEAVSQMDDRGEIHFFHLMGDVLALGCGAHGVALDGLGENHCRPVGGFLGAF